MEFNDGSDSGTDDDLPPSFLRHQILQAQGASAMQASGTKRPGCGTHFDRFSATDDKYTQELEMDAYTAVLRAFSAQSTGLTWTKERLMCDLRKQLRISEEQHRQLTEELEARQTRGLSSVKVSEFDPASDMQIATSFRPNSSSPSAFPGYRKNLKNSYAPQAPQVVALLQLPVSQSSYEIQSKRPQTGKGKGRQVAGAVIGASSSKVPGSHLSSNQNLQSLPLAGGNTAASNIDLNCEGSGRGKDLKNLLLCREVLPAAAALTVSPVDKAHETQFGPYLGQKVQRLWGADKKIYAAVIVDYDLESGKHALVYDMETPKESYEWVNFKDIAKGEIKFVEGPPISLLGRNLEPPPPRGRGRGKKAGGVGRGRGKSYSKTPFSGLAGGSSPIKGYHVDPGRTLRKENVAAADDMKEIDLKEGRSPGPARTVKDSVPDLNQRGGIAVKVPVISDILEEANNLGEIVDMDTLANMKQKVDFVAEAFRTALHDLGDSSNEDAEGDTELEDIKGSDQFEVTKEEKTTQSEKVGVVDISGDNESPVL